MLSQAVVGPYFFENGNTVTGNSKQYADMFVGFALSALDGNVNGWTLFQQAGAIYISIGF